MSIGNFRRECMRGVRYLISMTPEAKDRLFKAMTKLGYNDTTLARAAGVKRTYVSDIRSGKTGSPSVDGLAKLCKVLGMSVAELLDGETKLPIRVPIIGELTYGDIWRPKKVGKGLPDILNLWSVSDDLIAVRVLESNMSPRFQRGDVVMGNRIVSNNADNYIGIPCIIKTTDDRYYVKILTRGTTDNTYTLRSLDPSEEDIKDVVLEWFAPVVSIMPYHSV